MGDLAARLQFRPGQRILLKNAPAGVREALRPLPEGARLADAKERQADAALIFVSRAAQVEAELSEALPRLADAEDPVLWFAYPAAGEMETDLDPEHGWEALEQAGWSTAGASSVNGVWSAIRFRKA